MRKYFLLFFTLSIVPVFGCAGTGVLITQWNTTLHHIPVYFVSRPELPIVDVGLVINAGSARDMNQWGLAALTANTLSEGTVHQSAINIAKIFDENGAIYNADTNRDFSVISLRTMTQEPYFSRAVHLYLDLLSRPTFEPTACQRIQKQTIDAIKIALQDPAVVAARTLYRDIYGTHPYAHPVLGDIKTIKLLTPTEIKMFYKQYYVAHNAKIILIGNLRTQDAILLAERLAAALPIGSPAPVIARALPVSCNDTHPRQSIFMNVSQTSILLGLLGVDYHVSHYFDLLVANHILGGASLNSLLMHEVRDKYGYTYGVYSQFSPLAARGPFIISLKTRAEKADLAEKAVLNTLKQYNLHGPTQNQLSLAKAQLSGNFLLDISSNTGILSYVTFVATAGLPLDYLEKYTDCINQVTQGSAKKAFTEMTSRCNLNIVRAGQK